MRLNNQTLRAMAEEEQAYLLRGKIQMNDAHHGRERLGNKAGCGSENKIAIGTAVPLKGDGHPDSRQDHSRERLPFRGDR